MQNPCEHQPAKASDYKLMLRNTGAVEDGEKFDALKASSAIHAAEDSHIESSSKTLET